MLARIVMCVVVGALLGALAAGGELATYASDATHPPDGARLILSAAWTLAPAAR